MNVKENYLYMESLLNCIHLHKFTELAKLLCDVNRYNVAIEYDGLNLYHYLLFYTLKYTADQMRRFHRVCVHGERKPKLLLCRV